MTQLFDLPFNTVIELYLEKLQTEENNNIRNRTRLLRKYPELFNKRIMKEIETIHQLSSKYIQYQSKKPIPFPIQHNKKSLRHSKR